MLFSTSNDVALTDAHLLDQVYCLATLFARRGETGEMLFWLVIFGAFIGAVCGTIYAATYLVNQWRYNSHSYLFYALCGVHGLDRNSRAMLKQVVRHHKMTEPARVFTEPQWLDPAGLGKPFAARADNLLMLRKRLFAIEKKFDS